MVSIVSCCQYFFIALRATVQMRNKVIKNRHRKLPLPIYPDVGFSIKITDKKRKIKYVQCVHLHFALIASYFVESACYLVSQY